MEVLYYIHIKSAELQHLVTIFVFQHDCPTSLKGGEWQAAIFLLACMSAVLVPTTAVTVAAAISACEKCVQWTMALQIFAEAATKMQLDVVSQLGSSFASFAGDGGRQRSVGNWDRPVASSDCLQYTISL